VRNSFNRVVYMIFLLNQSECKPIICALINFVLGGDFVSGMRCGKNTELNDTTWTRYIYSPTCGKPDGTPCDDLNACTQTDICEGGICVGSNPVVCTALDQCHDAGTCDSTNGCSQPIKANNTACDDGDSCTDADVCISGVCKGTSSCPVASPTSEQINTPVQKGAVNSAGQLQIAQYLGIAFCLVEVFL